MASLLMRLVERRFEVVALRPFISDGVGMFDRCYGVRLDRAVRVTETGGVALDNAIRLIMFNADPCRRRAGRERRRPLRRSISDHGLICGRLRQYRIWS